MGLRPDEFWRLTHAEFHDMLDGWIRGLRRRENEITKTAWRTAYYTRVKQMPDLKTLLLDEDEQPQERPAQTVDEMMAAVRMINAAWGGTEVEA